MTMATNKNRRSTKNKKVQKKGDAFVWTRPGFFTLAIVFVLALVWAFILGILVGRGYHPEAYIPGLSMLFSQTESKAKESLKAGNNDQKGKSVLRSEELGFYEELLRSPKETRTGTNPLAKKGLGGERKSGPTKRRAYRYVYQVAAFQTKKPAEDLFQRLSDNGYRAMIKKVQKGQRVWYRVFVPFEGLPEEAERFKNKLAGLGGTNPFIRQKERLVD